MGLRFERLGEDERIQVDSFLDVGAKSRYGTTKLEGEGGYKMAGRVVRRCSAKEEERGQEQSLCVQSLAKGA